MAQSLQWLGKNHLVILKHLEAVTSFLGVVLFGPLWIALHIRKKTSFLQIRTQVLPFLPFKSILG